MTLREPDTTQSTVPQPAVSVVLPTLNERAFISDCLRTLRAQDYPNIAEIVVVDGGSEDGTRELVEAAGGLVRLVDNPRVTAASAMNIGIDAARSSIIVRADAHTIYAPDYISKAIEALEQTGAKVVGGGMRAVGVTAFGRAVAAVTSSPVGIGPGKFHYAEEPQEVETVYLGVYDKSTVTDVGGYDEDNLQWAAEDQELNFRIRRAGGTIYLDPRIQSQYFPRQTVKALRRQYHNYGICKASTLVKHHTLPYWRPLAPAAMVAGTAGWVALSLVTRPAAALVPFVGYSAAAGAAAKKIAREPGVDVGRTILALALCHWGYGLGFWRGISWYLRGKPFENRPSGHR